MASKSKPRNQSLVRPKPLKDGEDELRRLLTERQRLDERIEKEIWNVVARAEKALQGREGRQEPVKVVLRGSKTEGMTGLIRGILKRSGWLHATEVRDALETEGFDLGRYSKAMSTVNVVLTRLVGKAEVEKATSKSHKNIYRWKR